LTPNAFVKTDVDNYLVSDPNSYIVGVGVQKITVDDTAPTDPAIGDLWISTV
jgi:hypothetical protein